MSVDICNVTVAQYGHAVLKGNRHYAILVYCVLEDPKKAYCYEVQGDEGLYRYVRKKVSVVKPDTASTFLGQIWVGTVGRTEHAKVHFDHICSLVPIVQGDKNWNCQNWVADALCELVKAKVQVQSYDRASLVEAMKDAKMIEENE
jgi:hypothetical protein